MCSPDEFFLDVFLKISSSSAASGHRLHRLLAKTTCAMGNDYQYHYMDKDAMIKFDWTLSSGKVLQGLSLSVGWQLGDKFSLRNQDVQTTNQFYISIQILLSYLIT